jgi:hypothetical protein
MENAFLPIRTRAFHSCDSWLHLQSRALIGLGSSNTLDKWLAGRAARTNV